MKMLIYNITIKIEHSLEEEWLQWQRDVYVPAVMSTGLFYKHRFFRLLEQDETDGKTYILQFYAANKIVCEQYVEQYSETIKKMSIEKWGSNFISFQSLLESVQ